jgi:hypothetical protein
MMMADPGPRVVLSGKRIHLLNAVPGKNFLSPVGEKFSFSFLGFIPIFVIIKI